MRVIFTALLLLVSAALSAQSSVIKGTVRNTEGKPLPAAAIAVMGESGSRLDRGQSVFDNNDIILRPFQGHSMRGAIT